MTNILAEHNMCINEKALKVSYDVVHIIEQLRANHEEADTLILLHAADQARQGPKTLKVHTDVFVFSSTSF